MVPSLKSCDGVLRLVLGMMLLGPMLMMGPPPTAATVGMTSLLAEVRRPKQVNSALLGEPCQTKPHNSWTSQENWVWKQVCQGKMADFNTLNGYGGELDPKSAKEWRETRILRPAFLETILLHEPYRSALTRSGVSIRGAWLKNSLNLSHATLLHLFLLENSRIEQDVDLHGLKTSDLIGLSGSTFTGALSMNGLQAGGLFMGEEAMCDAVDLTGAKIAGQVDMRGSTFTGTLSMNGLQAGGLFMGEKATFGAVELTGAKIAGPVDMRGSTLTGALDMNGLQAGGLFIGEKATFGAVELTGAKIAGQVDMHGSTFTGALDMNGLQAGDLFMREKTMCDEVDLTGAKITGQVDMSGSTFTGALSMNGLQVGEGLFIRNATIITSPLNLIFATIERNLDLSGSILPWIDLTGTRVLGRLMLASSIHGVPTWQKDARLTLRNTMVGALQDLQKAWPDHLELDGFTYLQLGGLTASSATDQPDDMVRRDISWFREWLRKQARFSRQPYVQLASILEKQGYKDKADHVLYVGRDRERREARGIHWLSLFLQKIFVGYGYYPYYALWWSLGLLLLGAVVLKVSGQGRFHGMPYGIVYSFDLLVPIIKLREQHYKIELAGWARYYFYFHKLMGYILA